MEKAYAEYELNPSLRDTIFLGQFEQGLLEKWKKHLRHPIDSFEDALQQARLAEAVEGQLINRSSEIGRSTAETASKKSQQQAEASAESGRGQSKGKSITCFHCQKKGHYAAECRSKPSGKKANVKCFECQQRGHYAAECPSRLTVATTETTEQRSSQVNTVSPGPLAFIQIQMQGVTTEALIDTGSSVNIKDTALYERVGGVIQLCEGALSQAEDALERL